MDKNTCLHVYNKVLTYSGDIEFAKSSGRLMQKYSLTFLLRLARTSYLPNLENIFSSFLASIKYLVEPCTIPQILRKYLGTLPRQNGITNDYFKYCQSIFSFIDLPNKDDAHKIREILQDYFKNQKISIKDIHFYITIIYRLSREQLSMEENLETRIVEDHIRRMYQVLYHQNQQDNSNTSVSSEDYTSED